MKKIFKKLVSFVIVCALALPIPSAVFANKYEDNEKAEYGLLKSLKIIQDNERNPEEIITRAEFCDMTAKMMNLDIPLSSAYYSDVPSSHKYAVSVYALSELGIVKGTGEQEFKPEKPISANQAAAILVKALNWYDTLSSPVVYPLSYISKAEQLGVMKGINVTGENSLSYEDVVNIIYNALFAKVANIDMDGHLDKSSNALETFHDLSENDGICTANYVTSLSGTRKSKCKKDQIEIDGTIHNLFFGRASEYIGFKVKYYENDDGDIVHIEKYGSKEVSVDYEDITDFSVNNLKYNYNNSVKSAYISAGADLIYNGVSYPEYTLEDIQTDGKNGSVTLVDNDGKNGYDVVIIWEYTSYVVNYADEESKILYYFNYKTDGVDNASEPASRHISFKDADEIEVIRTDGKQVPFSQLLTNDAASVFESKDKSFVKIILSPQKLYGTVTTTSGDDIVITSQDGTAKKYTVECRDASMKNALKVGYSGEFILNHKGAICGISNFYGEEFKYGYLIATNLNTKGVEKSLEAKILCTDNKIKIYNVTDKTKLDGSRCSDITELNSRLQDYDENAGKYYIKQQLIRYKLSEDESAITYIDTEALGESESKDSSLEIVRYSDSDNEYRPNNRYVNRKLVVDINGLVVFCVPKIYDRSINASEIEKADDEEYYVLYDLKGYKREEKIKLDAAITDKDGGTSNCIVLPSAYTPKRPSGGNESYKDRGTKNFGIVESVGRGIDDNGEDVPVIRLITDANVISVRCKYEECVLKNVYTENGVVTDNTLLLKKGDAITYYTDSDGIIRYVSVTFDTDRIDNGRFSVSGAVRDGKSCGIVYSKSAKGMKMMRLRTDAALYNSSDPLLTFDDNNFAVQTLAEKTTKYFVYDSENDIIRKGSLFDIRDYVNNPENPSIVCQKETFTIPDAVYIYN